MLQCSETTGFKSYAVIRAYAMAIPLLVMVCLMHRARDTTITQRTFSIASKVAHDFAFTPSQRYVAR